MHRRRQGVACGGPQHDVLHDGQGAGVAAAISFKTGRAFDDLDVRLVRSELERQGVQLA